MRNHTEIQPNILLICVDHWPGDLLGAAGHPCVMTPTLDQLAANGVRYTNAYSASPTCIPSRRGLMTGTTARTLGDRVFSETTPMSALPTLAQAFSRAGYQTYAVGKLHVYPQRDRIGFDDVILNEEGRHHLEGNADDLNWLKNGQLVGLPEKSFELKPNRGLSRPTGLEVHVGALQYE